MEDMEITNQIKVRIEQVENENKDFIFLCGKLDEYLNQAIGGESKREKYKKFNHLDTMDYVVVIYDGKTPAGCGALRKYSEKEIEVKRVFVREEYRGRHIGDRILKNLISQAKEMGFQRMLLETGAFLQASVHLYSKYGFEKIENYGAYKDMEESLCMALEIVEDNFI